MVNLNDQKLNLIERDIFQSKLNERVNRQKHVAAMLEQ